MIIGISGKIGSGKDLIGKIIQILTCFPNISTDKLIKDLDKDYDQYIFEIQKFGGALKDIVCLLINCTREQLEDQDFKNTELGEEWWVHYTQPRVGFGFNLLPYTGNKEESHLTIHKLTPRKLLQLIGTEAGRNIIHPNLWVNALMSRYKPIEDYPIIIEEEYIKDNYIYPNWIITDVRFPNEVKAIEDKGGFIIRVNRYPKTITRSKSINEHEEIPFDINNEKHRLLWEGQCKQAHPSENSLDNYLFNVVIDNNGTIKELIEKVKIILKTKNDDRSRIYKKCYIYRSKST